MRMKKVFCVLFCLMLAAGAAGCGSSSEASGRVSNNTKGVEDVLQEEMAQADAAAADKEAAPEESDISEPPEAAPQSQTGESPAAGNGTRPSGLNEDAPLPETDPGEEVLSTEEGIDVDLTALSSTMVYSEVYNMLCEPESYIGKTVKMTGVVLSFHVEETGKTYYGCLIKDATACCSQGLEFVLTDEYAFPDDYPEDGQTATIVGVFDTYMEGQNMYCNLRDATVV